MPNDYKGPERREFFRYRYEKPIRYQTIQSKDKKYKQLDAISKDLSVSGILFTTKNAPTLSSILILDLDYRTSSICQEIESNALIVNNRLVGKAVRIEDAGNKLYDVGVAFVKKTGDLPAEVKAALK